LTEKYWIAIIGVLTIVLKGKAFWRLSEKYLFHKVDNVERQENKITAYLEERIKDLEEELKEERAQKELLMNRVIKKAVKSHGKKNG